MVHTIPTCFGLAKNGDIIEDYLSFGSEKSVSKKGIVTSVYTSCIEK